jgi:hypothetical protein
LSTCFSATPSTSPASFYLLALTLSDTA